MRFRVLGKTGIYLPIIGFGAFKIGRNVGIKYPNMYQLPSDKDVERLLNALLNLGVQYIDTAPAYGTSEEQIGRAIARRRSEFVLSTKIGEDFSQGVSKYDFSFDAAQKSVERSLSRLKTKRIDIVFVHSDGRSVSSILSKGCVRSLQQFKQRRVITAIGFSGKTAREAEEALSWADVLMVEYNQNETSHNAVMHQAAAQGIGVVVKKGLASGRLSAQTSIPFILSHPAVTSLVIGGLDLEHFKENIRLAESCDPADPLG